MRALLLPTFMLATFAAAAVDARAAGAYASSAASDQTACARICADDGLCVAWNYRQDGVCELRATIPAAQSGAHGLSLRAPQTLRDALDDASPAVVAEAEAPIPAAAADDISDQLLGGPEQDATGLRR